MPNETVWFDDSEVGAPTLNNAAGSHDSVLNACLVTGFNAQTLTGITVAGGVATCTKAGHGFGDKRVLEIGGSTPGALNGRKLITVTGSGSFTFPAPSVPDGPATGTITAKRAPLGWTRPLSTGNVSIYQRTDVTATGMKLRVDDSGSGAASSTAARWRMIEAFTDLNTFTGPAPGASVYGGAGVYVPKGADTAAAKKWVLVGDGRTFYFFCEAASYTAAGYLNTVQGIFAFGDIEPYRAGDPYACLLAGSSAAASTDSQALGQTVDLTTAPPSPATVLCRPFNGIGAPVQANMVGTGARRIGGAGPAYPSPVDNGLVIATPILLNESNSAFANPIRGHVRGIGCPFASIPGGLLHLTVIENLVGSDRRWLMVGFNQQGNYGHAAFDITGPW